MLAIDEAKSSRFGAPSPAPPPPTVPSSPSCNAFPGFPDCSVPTGPLDVEMQVAAGAVDLQEKEEEEHHEMGCCVYCLYYIALFFVHWFGAESFDQNGDGEFDPGDVEAWMQSVGILRTNFKRPAHIQKELSLNSKSKAAKQQQELQHAQTDPKNGGTSQALASASKAVKSMKVAVEAGASKAIAEMKEVVEQECVLDQNGDGKIDLMDIVESKVNGRAEEKIIWDKIHKKRKIPFFCILQISICMIIWMVFQIKSMLDGSVYHDYGLDSFSPGWATLRLFGPDCADDRSQVWRWLLYQFTHTGVGHVGMNCFMTILLGLPLEMIEGCRRMFLMFNFGVVGGAIMYMVLNAHGAVVGMSGGCYALIGIHLADLLMNWNQKRFRKPALLFLLILGALDITSYALTMGGNTSISAHAGGFFAGLVIGIVVGKNYEVKCIEKVMIWNSVLGGIAFATCAFVWVYTNPAAQNWFEAAAGVAPWCWTQQVYNPTYSEGWFCVRCGDQDCINFWTSQDQHKPVNFVACTELVGGLYEPWPFEADTWEEAQSISSLPTTTR